MPNSSKKTIQKLVTESEENKINVLASINQNPHVSVGTIACEIGITKSSVHNIVKDCNFDPFKLHTVQVLTPSDYDRRLNFIVKLSNFYNAH